MGFLDRLLHNNTAVIGMKMAEADEHPTPATSIPLANGDSWPSDMDFYGYASGAYCREYATSSPEIARHCRSKCIGRTRTAMPRKSPTALLPL